MKFFLIKRIAQTFVTIFVVATLMFTLFRLMPGDPTMAFMGGGMSPEAQAAQAERFGLNDPLHEQYLQYIMNVFTLDFGRPFFQHGSVRDIILYRAVNTFVLMGSAFLIAYSIGISLGAYAGWKSGSTSDIGIFTMGIVFRSVPVFLTGLLMLYIFAYTLDMFPIGGMSDRATVYESRWDLFFSVEFLRHLVLPVAGTVTFYMAYPLLLMRTAVLKTKGQSHIKIAKARGLSERSIFVKHVFRNSLLPITTALPIAIGFAIAGNVLIEVIFSWPGIGRTLVSSIHQQDYPLAQGAFVVIAFIFIIGNLIADILYTKMDPRITYGDES